MQDDNHIDNLDAIALGVMLVLSENYILVFLNRYALCICETITPVVKLKSIATKLSI